MTNTTDNDIRARLLGAWRLLSWQIIAGDGTIDYPLGPDAIGQLMYDGEADRVSAQLVRVNTRYPFIWPLERTLLKL